MDRQDPAGLRQTLRTLSALWDKYGYDIAISALEEAAQVGRLDRTSPTVLALRIATLGLNMDLLPGPDLGHYDRLLLDPIRVSVN